jgi:hypothetical protein
MFSLIERRKRPAASTAERESYVADAARAE